MLWFDGFVQHPFTRTSRWKIMRTLREYSISLMRLNDERCSFLDFLSDQWDKVTGKCVYSTSLHLVFDTTSLLADIKYLTLPSDEQRMTTLRRRYSRGHSFRKISTTHLPAVKNFLLVDWRSHSDCGLGDGHMPHLPAAQIQRISIKSDCKVASFV